MLCDRRPGLAPSMHLYLIADNCGDDREDHGRSTAGCLVLASIDWHITVHIGRVCPSELRPQRLQVLATHALTAVPAVRRRNACVVLRAALNTANLRSRVRADLCRDRARA